VLKTRQHLAAIKPQDKGLMLELMHFPEELLEPAEFKLPPARSVSRAEMTMARDLIKSMSTPWKPEEYQDEYHEALEKVIAEKAKHPDSGKKTRQRAAKPASNVIDLAEVLRQSLRETRAGKRKPAAKGHPAKARRKAA
jgi:DNA end-binding protein Ku